jgi:EAL domain-containing protein (putative c-di-GMP-specific phosphodiesterase class I)
MDRAERPVRVPIEATPFRIGRGLGVDLVLHSPRISKHHCQIERRDDGVLVLRDLGSRNGTFLNGERVVGSRSLQEGDVLHIAHLELRYVKIMGKGNTFAADERTEAGAPTDDGVLAFYQATKDLFRILDGPAVRAVFQPIVTLQNERIVGYEALGRHTLPSLSFEVAELFRVAHERGKAEELASLMRTAALDEAPRLPDGDAHLFMNVHPAEMVQETYLRELERSRQALGDSRVLVAEIHESAVADPATMRDLKARLKERGVELAYDDFGVGQSRLMEIAEAPPDYVKLDIALVHHIEQSDRRQELVAALVKVMQEAGIAVVAEGIETARERDTCRALGCDLGQGFFFRHPLPAGDLRETIA